MCWIMDAAEGVFPFEAIFKEQQHDQNDYAPLNKDEVYRDDPYSITCGADEFHGEFLAVFWIEDNCVAVLLWLFAFEMEFARVSFRLISVVW